MAKRLLLIALVSVAAGFPQTNQRDKVKEDRIVQQLTTVAPQAVDDFRNATVAMDRADWPGAAAGFRKVVQKAPNFSPGVRRLGISLVESGERVEGLKLLNQAIALDRSPENLISLAQCLGISKTPGETTPEERETALGIAKEAAQFPSTAGDPSYPTLVAQLALQANELPDFRQALGQLRREYPNLMLTHYFAAFDAALKEEWGTSEDEIRKAGSLGLPKSAVDGFLQSTSVGAHARAWRWAKYSAFLVGAWALALAFLLIAGKYLSGRTLASIETADPNSSLSSSEASIRGYYRSLIQFAGSYYYISLPVVILLVIAVAGSVIYGFLLLGRIPIRLILILGVGGLITIWKMIQSLLVKIATEDPGRALTREEAPALWGVADEVAAKVGTRPIDDIRVTPGTEMAVYEHGSRRERELDHAKRILLMGVGLLNGFQQPAFRAVLAHEYGHFSHRDTAGGDVALRVNQDMMKFAVAMAQHGQAVWYNIAFQFLRLYHFIFRRITYGATRLQEVLADRVAARLYGSLAFEQGLTHVIRRSVEFQHEATQEIERAKQACRPLRDLYALEASSEPSVDEEVSKVLAAPTTEDNTHPGPADRFRLVSRVTTPSDVPAEGAVWDLFPDRSKLTSEMSAMVQARLT
jgi:Zn-dependent protease with chaperone function